ncbi:peptide deformylase [Facklamia miroungae]|uniref:Peptide deformylase n=1 Tax=Facklamia miroungae TaxID=120956 RepID=A0A1G7U3U4_9LACT|nr:peptide deformylase [Facklamia miroungae]NKZ29896.1 peptide deformylase [Facklamia miroungae]SDG42074.1 peptide deformylase [Facklamia miroungae]
MLTMKDIIKEGHPTLRLKAKKVTFPMDPSLKQKAMEMLEFLKNSQDKEKAEKYGLRPGVGLAAPQINISKQIFAMHIYQFDDEGNISGEEMSQIFVNPVITRHSVQEVALSEGEGCLSVDREVEGYVPRPQRITLKYQDLEGNEHSLKLRNYQAVVAQHEIDHLHGIMFYDHINEQAPWYAKEDLHLI